MSYTLPPQSTEACEQARSLLMELAMEMPFDRRGTMDDRIALSSQDKMFLEAHLADCEACVLYQKSMGYLTASLSHLDTIPVPTGLEERIMQSVRSQSGHLQEPQSEDVVFLEPAKHHRTVRWLKPQMAVAATALLLALAIPMLLPTLKDEKVANKPEVAVHRQVTPVVAQPPTSSEMATLSTPQAESKAMVATAPIVERKKAVPSITPAKRAVNTEYVALAHPASKVSEAASHDDFPDAATTESDLYDDPVSNLVGF